MGEVTKVERVGGSGTSVTSVVVVGIDEEHVLRWVHGWMMSNCWM